jgi:hypothetical protein
VTDGDVAYVSGYRDDLDLDVADFFEGWPRPSGNLAGRLRAPGNLAGASD